MTRQFIAALVLAVSATTAVRDVQAGCHGPLCHPGITLNGFHARFGCTPREAFVLFQKNPELITRFPEMAQFLQSQFGPLTATAPATGVAPATAAIPATAAAPVTPATPAAVTTPPAAAATDTAVSTDEPIPTAAAAPVEAAPLSDAATPAADTAEVAAPVGATTSSDAAAPTAAPPVSPELQPLLGLWVNENSAADQAIAKINLNSDGSATVTVNTALGQTEVTKPFTLEDNTFRLDGSDFAKVISADANKVVLEAGGTNLTFVRQS